MSLRPRMFEIARSLISGGEMPGRWRCSPDMANELNALRFMRPFDDDLGKPSFDTYELQSEWGGYPAGTRMIAPPPSLDGVPIVVDEALPRNSLILDSARTVARTVASDETPSVASE